MGDIMTLYNQVGMVKNSVKNIYCVERAQCIEKYVHEIATFYVIHVYVNEHHGNQYVCS